MSSKLQLDVRHLNIAICWTLTRYGVVLLQVKLCDPCLSALKRFVYHARRYTSARLFYLLNIVRKRLFTIDCIFDACVVTALYCQVCGWRRAAPCPVNWTDSSAERYRSASTIRLKTRARRRRCSLDSPTSAMTHAVTARRSGTNHRWLAS